MTQSNFEKEVRSKSRHTVCASLVLVTANMSEVSEAIFRTSRVRRLSQLEEELREKFAAELPVTEHQVLGAIGGADKTWQK